MRKILIFHSHKNIHFCRFFFCVIFLLFTHHTIAADLDAPHDDAFGAGCLSCHDMAAYDRPSLIPGTGVLPQDIDDCDYNRVCYGCHDGVTALEEYSHSSFTTSDKYGTWRVGCSICHNQHTQEQDIAFGTTYGKFIRRNVDLSKILDNVPPAGATVSGKSGSRKVKFIAPTGANSFADGDGTIDGICQVCHTKTNHFRNSGEVNFTSNGYDHSGTVGTDCMNCHGHSGGFAHGKGSSGNGCIECHGHDAGILYDADMSVPYTAGVTASPGKGTFQSHSTHTETDADDVKGPGIYCNTCHDTGSFPFFNSGTDANGDGRIDLSETDVCDSCHSSGGTYDGIDDPVIGAKAIWHDGAYVATDNSTLQAGKEKWCAGCHDESPSVIKAVSAPDVIGDEDGAYTYGTGWGYYKTGHGLQAGEQFPSKGGVETLSGRPINCDSCHDYATAHVDGLARTYDDGNVVNLDPKFYRQGYRLKLIDGQEPYTMPRPSNIGNSSDQYRVCFQGGCHDFIPFNDPDYTTADTNFISYGGAPTAEWRNRHQSHLVFNNNDLVAADWSGLSSTDNNSRMTCVVCHNVHGSTQLAMIRDGKLINRDIGSWIWYKNDAITYIETNTTNPPIPEDLPLSASDGTAWISSKSTMLCGVCHNHPIGTTDRDPFQNVAQAPFLEWVGTDGLISDGVAPDSGIGNSIFTFRVSYSDLNNDSPSPIEVWVDLDDSSTYDDTNSHGETEKFAMVETDITDTNIANGKIYTKGLAIAKDGDGVLNYRFYANDGGLDATGAPTADSTLTVTNNSPVLTWTEESYFETDGVHPNIGGNGANYLFRVTYTDTDGECPPDPTNGDIQVVVDGVAYNLTNNDSGACNTGRIYFTTIPISSASPPQDLTYSFTATDGIETAVGNPTLNSTLTVLSGTNNPPQLDWAAAESCLTDGVKPVLGLATAPFDFKVMYTDIENTPPSRIEVWVDLNDNETVDTGEKQDMSLASGDGDYTNGEVYSSTWTLNEADAGIHNYAFLAKDLPGLDAVGEPTQTSGTRTVEVLSTSGANGVRAGSGDTGPIWYNSIQTAIDAISGEHTVLVYDGTYYEDVVFSYWAHNTSNKTTLRSVCGPDTTIINGSGSTSAVYFSKWSNSKIDGFGVTGGTHGIHAKGQNDTSVAINNCKIYGNDSLSGGGIFIENAVLTLTNSEIYNNNSDMGGGVKIWRGSGHIISNTIIRDNTSYTDGSGIQDGGGGVHLSQIFDGGITISNSVIRDNVSDKPGGGLLAAQVPYSTGAGLTVIDSIISGNTGTWGGGVYTANTTTANFIRSSLIGNTASWGGAIGHPNANTTYFENCIIADNQAGTAGMSKDSGGTLDIINSTIVNNRATTDNGGVFYLQNDPTVTIHNSILWGNQAATTGWIGTLQSGSLTITDSIIQSGGDGNYTNAPLFTGGATLVVSGFASEEDPWFVGGGDYHIQALSPAINNASATYAPDLDIDGQIRPQGSADDIGVDEFYP